MILHGTTLSSYTAKVRLALALKGLAIDLVAPPGGYRSAEYRAIVPMGMMPALVDGDLTLSESDTIIEYLEDLHPTPSVLPGDARARAWARFLSRFHDLYLEPHVRALFPLVAPAGRDQGKVAASLAAIQARLDQLEGFLRLPYAAGPAPSLADCAFPATFAFMDAIVPALGRSVACGERTRAWRATLAAHPVFESIMAPYREEAAAWLKAKLA